MYEPITKRLIDSLYVPQCSRSIRGGTWLDLDTLGALGAGALRVLGGSIGVVDIMGRLKAAGSMSGIVSSRA